MRRAAFGEASVAPGAVMPRGAGRSGAARALVLLRGAGFRDAVPNLPDFAEVNVAVADFRAGDFRPADLGVSALRRAEVRGVDALPDFVFKGFSFAAGR